MSFVENRMIAWPAIGSEGAAGIAGGRGGHASVDAVAGGSALGMQPFVTALFAKMTSYD